MSDQCAKRRLLGRPQRRWQTCFPRDEKNERRVVLEFNVDKEIRTYIERRKS